MHWGCFFLLMLSSVAAASKIKAAIVILCRNNDLDEIRRSLREFEDRFNRRYHYPYVFFNDEPFSDTFKEKVVKHISAPASFELLSHEEWSIPPFLNQSRIQENCQRMKEEGIIYGGSISYRHMCHWYSGYFFRHPALANYEWYWRVEPGVHFFCDIQYDPFEFMIREGKLYGFNIALREIEQTVPSLWNSTLAFREEYGPKYQSSLLKDFFEKDGRYNLCHFWSNFEIASLNLWRSPDYLAYFNYLDQKGGFYYERLSY
jgi:alpha 1,2-mannosyltransferase